MVSFLSNSLHIFPNSRPTFQSRAVYGVGLRPFTCWDCGFESRRRHGSGSVVNVVCCQGPITRTKDATECGVSECDRGTPYRRNRPTGTVKRWEKIPLLYYNYCLALVICLVLNSTSDAVKVCKVGGGERGGGGFDVSLWFVSLQFRGWTHRVIQYAWDWPCLLLPPTSLN